MDEPTVIGRRPLAPTPNIQRGQSSVRVPSGAAAARFPVTPTPVAEPGGVGIANHAEIVAQGLFEPTALEDTLVAAATPILLIVAQLRMVENADIGAMRRGTVEQIRRFEERAVKNQARRGDVSAARYLICALVDEAVMTTPWGSESAWSDNSLLNQFHNETWGGEKVFQIVERIQAEPAKYLALLKLVNVCLLMGFEGKYRVMQGGREQLEDLRAEVHRLLGEYTTAPPAQLSGEWRGIRARTSVRKYGPLWIAFAVAASVMLIGYTIFRWRLGSQLAAVEQLIESIGRSGPL
ncbi:type IVB secretion system protein IcmH/DotU [Bradyrhizobium sp. CCGUVB23]|uniref:type IVB secretion system protein IcmH/DotU n=1 Tax=Bradyrhizobium sp. CCGUVB23 TaxID=2949630 RepID=UPI0020B37208|nr:type IVB secretion system protein IcmH/DotU [Bradyrhizobium sp. CCGUVB23]MCP3460875.1 type IVB secretion system protein IcmH/DotU [Bradyrhizobium sp. CCGUVB23]